MESLRRNRWRRRIDAVVSFMFAAVIALVLWFAAVGAQAQPMPDDMAALNASYRSSEAVSRRLSALNVSNGPYTVPHTPHATPVPKTPKYTGSDVVERWRPLVTQYFQASDVEWALKIIACESGGNPDAANPTSSARGLLQHLGRFWPGRSEAAGWGGASIFDPEANIAVGAWLLARNGEGSWECKA